MATINLRPWREERRERLKQEFLHITVLVAIVGLGVWFGWRQLVGGWIEYQNSRNSVLEQEIKLLDGRVQEIKELRQKQDDLVARMKVIQGLQGTRPAIVYIFDEIAKTMPDGVYYTKLSRAENLVTVDGTAESNQRVSTLMRNLDESEWFANPNLTKMVANTSVSEQGNNFNLTFDVSKEGGNTESQP